MLSAWSPARRAARVAPVEALRGQVFAVDRREGRVRAAVGAVLTAGGLALVGLGAVDGSAYLGPGAAATAVGILVLGPVLARSLSRALGAPIGRMAGAPGQLARHNAARNPRRTSAAVLPIVIGLALTTMIASLAAATKAWAVSDMDRVFRADFLVRPLADPQDRGFTPLSLRVTDRLTVRVPESTSALVTGSSPASLGSCHRQRPDAYHIGDDNWATMPAMLLRLAYLGVTNALAMLRLLPMSDPAKDVEILVLRHQITVLERQLRGAKPRFDPADRALLATLLHRPATR